MKFYKVAFYVIIYSEKVDLGLNILSTSTAVWGKRKPVFGVCDQSRLKLACSATETS